MEIKINLISIETIKPSSPTPKPLQIHRLSFLDQLAPPLFSSFVYFYQSNPIIPNSHKTNQLKKSLSEILSTFYPLAGSLIGNLYVNCKDGGVPFSEAEADCHLSQVIINKNQKDVERFLPYKTDDPQMFCMAVQTTYFRCGGVAVGILLSHKIADALSFLSFINTWSAFVRNGDGDGVPSPKFDAAAYFPPVDSLDFLPPTEMVERGIVTCRIFTFPAATIAALREKYAAGGRRPSRVEALSAFIWTRFISATGMESDPNKICTFRNVVNLRTRADPPLTEYFGNIVGHALAKPTSGDGGVEFLQKVREAVKAVGGGHMALMKNGEKQLKEMTAHQQADRGFDFSISSLCGFPLYEADFGWGKPDWVGLGPLHHNKLAVFIDTRYEGGIEAMVYLTKQDTEKFEANLKLQMLKSNL